MMARYGRADVGAMSRHEEGQDTKCSDTAVRVQYHLNALALHMCSHQDWCDIPWPMSVMDSAESREIDAQRVALTHMHVHDADTTPGQSPDAMSTFAHFV